MDTGAPTSFGKFPQLTIAGEKFFLGTNYLGLTAPTLSQFLGVTCAGILGGDILGRFDQLIDNQAGTLIVSTAELSHSGRPIPLEEFMGLPIVTVRIGGRDYRMFFDTGAQISYFQADSLREFPSAGSFTDFYPGLGEFQTETYNVPISLGGLLFTLRCGSLPPLLQRTLRVAGVEGIVGNEILRNRNVGYFPRRRRITI